MATDPLPPSLERDGVTALNLMEKALSLLDGCGPTGDVGPHLDLAICRLKDLLGLPEAKS